MTSSLVDREYKKGIYEICHPLLVTVHREPTTYNCHPSRPLRSRGLNKENTLLARGGLATLVVAKEAHREPNNLAKIPNSAL